MASVRGRGLVLIALCWLVVRGSYGGGLPDESVLDARDSRALASLRDALNAVELGTLTECLSLWDMHTEVIFPSESYRHSFDFAPERARSRRTRVVSYETGFQTVDRPFAVYAPQWNSGGRDSRATPMVADRSGLQVLRLAFADDSVYQHLEQWITRSDFPMVDLRVSREDSAEADDVENYLVTFMLKDGDVAAWRATYFSATETAFFETRSP
jgi:hypothetical protein